MPPLQGWVRYLKAIADGGPDRARELRPPSASLAPAPLPEYESRVDHAGLLQGLDSDALDRGRELYGRLCVNCHGTPDREGSLPGSRRFATEPLKNGADPLSIYRTITHGYGRMEAQTRLVPRQKYDVIHYVREQYLKPLNPSQYVEADGAYLASLPPGDTLGPEPSEVEPWRAMDYGPFLSASIEVSPEGPNIARKGVAVRLDGGPGGVAAGRAWALFDHDTMRMAAAWEGDGFIDWHGILFDGEHAVHPRVVGDVFYETADAPGWADPETGRFDDPRPLGRDGRPYGPLPRSWAKYRGLHRHGDRVVFAYAIGETAVLESPGIVESDGLLVPTRTFRVGPRPKPLTLRVASVEGEVGARGGGQTWAALLVRDEAGVAHFVRAGLVPADAGPRLVPGRERDLLLEIPAGLDVLRFTTWTRQSINKAQADAFNVAFAAAEPGLDLEWLSHGGPSLWPESIRTDFDPGDDSGPFQVDILTTPDANPWAALVRPGGFDFFPDGDRMALCTWDGDVWIVSGLADPAAGLSWRRFATGLFQPLGVVVRNGDIYVGCRDQIAILRDLDGDGEADFYECFNNDHQVTEHFHEFAMDLQADDAGNFYYAKGARHAQEAVVPHHGTLLKVAPDGSSTEILATGFRAPNGVLLNPDGTFFMTDQEGHWTPKNRINWVRPGRFYGNLSAFTDRTDPSDSAMEPPVVWITNEFDRSPSEIVRVPANTWGPLSGSLLNLSYGYGKIFVIPHERVGGVMQGGMVALPIPPAPTGLIRGRFRPGDDHLYTCGLFAWAGDRQQAGGLYRVRATGSPIGVPVGLRARRGRLDLTFTEPIDPATASDASRFEVSTWSLRRTANYGSDHHDERTLAVAGSRLLPDGRTVALDLPDLAPTMGMEVRFELRSAEGDPVEGVLHNTIHTLDGGD